MTSEGPEEWTPRQPFSQRPAPPPPPAKEEPADLSDTPTEQDALDTQPIVLAHPPAPMSVEGFRVLDPEEVTPKERRKINMMITAFYHAQKLFTKKERGPAPEPYHERAHILKLIVDEIIPIGSALLVLVAVILAGIYRVIPGEAWGLVGLGAFIALVACSYLGYRAFWLWAHTYLSSTIDNITVQRASNLPLMVFKEFKQEVPASAYSITGTFSSDRNVLFSKFNISCYTVTIDTSADDDDFLHGMRYVRDADRLKAAVEENSRYAFAA